MVFHRIFPIGNLTPKPKLSFSQTCFPSRVTLKGFFFLILFFLFKNKIKISSDSKSILKIIIFTK